MKQSALTILGLSSFSTVLLVGQVAQAEPSRPATPTATLRRPLYVEFVNSSLVSNRVSAPDQAGCSCQQTDLDPNNLNSDTIGNLAIDQLGCDCAGCRNIAMQMKQASLQTAP